MLQGKAPVIASFDPSFYACWEGCGANSVRKALIELGFTDAEETAIGATIVKREYERMLREAKQDVIITSACASLNLLIEKHFPELRQYLAPVVSPMIAHAMDIKRRMPEAKVVFIGPCVAKSRSTREHALTRSSRSRSLTRCAYPPALRSSTNSVKASRQGAQLPGHGRHNKKHGYTRHGLSVHCDKRPEKLHECAKRPPKRQYPQVLYRACHVRRKLHRRPHYGKVHKLSDPAYILCLEQCRQGGFRRSAAGAGTAQDAVYRNPGA